MNRVDYCFQRCIIAEGFRGQPYNDATGKTVTCQPGGNLSWLYGINVENAGSIGLARVVLSYLIREKDTALQAHDWYPLLDEARASVFLEMAYNMGIGGILSFTSAIHYASLKAWGSCAASILDSKAAKQLPGRYKALANIIITGVVP